jgi:hypothetical protein
MTTPSTSTGTVAYDSRDSGHLPHATSPAAVAAELASLATAAFDGGRTNRPQNGTPATREHQ